MKAPPLVTSLTWLCSSKCTTSSFFPTLPRGDGKAAETMWMSSHFVLEVILTLSGSLHCWCTLSMGIITTDQLIVLNFPQHSHTSEPLFSLIQIFHYTLPFLIFDFWFVYCLFLFNLLAQIKYIKIKIKYTINKIIVVLSGVLVFPLVIGNQWENIPLFFFSSSISLFLSFPFPPWGHGL